MIPTPGVIPMPARTLPGHDERPSERPAPAAGPGQVNALAIAQLRAARSPGISEEDRAAYLDLLEREPRALSRDGGPIHLTASAVVVDEPIEHVALVWHRKGQFWVQPGGHIDEGETDLLAAARREAREEVGLDELAVLGGGPAVLHRHALSSAFGTCREHWDVQFLLRAAAPAAQLPLHPSAETPEAIWVPWPLIDGSPERSTAQLPAGTVADMPGKLDALARIVAALDFASPPDRQDGRLTGGTAA